MKGRGGSALLTALWIIAVLSVMVLSFVYEARQQGGVNLYVRERSRVSRLIEPGRILAEIVMLNYRQAPDWSEDQDLTELLEDDRWVVEKQQLKAQGKCTIGPILLDEERNEAGEFVNPATVTVEISTESESGWINVNSLSKAGGHDSKYMERWWMLFRAHNIPEELDTPDDGRINLWNILIASWDDWRDEDDTVSAIDGEECGAESAWYEKYEQDNDLDEDEFREYRMRPRNGRIPDVHEFEYLRGYREYPALLTGGTLNPWEKDKDQQIEVKGILDVLNAEGPEKLNVNAEPPVDVLASIPGIYEDPDEDESLEDARLIAQAILDGLRIMPEDYEVDETSGFWPYKDYHDLCSRVDEDIGSEVQQYLAFGPEEHSVFTVTIRGESMGMSHVVTAQAYVKDDQVRYIRWCENPEDN